jgi:hypothetical protein
MLCTFHHHLVHEGGWTVSAAADGAFLFNSPIGKPLTAVPTRERVDGAPAWLRVWAEEHNLDLDPEANMPQWDGMKPDYDMAVYRLLAAG